VTEPTERRTAAEMETWTKCMDALRFQYQRDCARGTEGRLSIPRRFIPMAVLERLVVPVVRRVA